MSFLPQDHPQLGSLELGEVFDWYDGPVLFAAHNELRYLFLGFAVDPGAYLYVRVSETRMVAIKTGLVSVRKAFEAPEVDPVFVYRLGEGLSALAADDIPIEWLPDDSWRLEDSAPTAVPFVATEFGAIAQAQGRPLIALKLETPQMSRTEFPARHMANVLYEFQELTTAANIDTVKSSPNNGDVVRDSELAAIYLAAASFVVVLAPAQQEGRLMPAPTSALDDVARLVEATSAGEEAFVTYVSPLSRRTRAHLRNLLQTLVEAGTDLSLFNASHVTGASVGYTITAGMARQRVEALLAKTDLPSREITWNAYLLAVDHTRLTLKVREAVPSGRRKKGRTRRASFEPSQRHLFANSGTGDAQQSPIYRVVLREDTQISEFNDSSKGTNTYALMTLEPLPAPKSSLD